MHPEMHPEPELDPVIAELYRSVHEEPFSSAVVMARALSDGRCARRRAHRIYAGDLVGMVPGFGPCCEVCST